VRNLSLFGLFLLAACNKSPTPGEPSGPIATASVDQAANNVAALPPAEKSEVAGTLPPASEKLRFVGKWAADEKSCQSAAWQFTDTNLKTPAGSSCSFERVTQVPGGYDIQATCTAEGPPTPDVLEIRFAESAKAMLFDSKTIAGKGLVFCGREA
jgi:hypothetical protein